ncbi:DUF647-domain-containing protein [Xylona heveae TC161]|uniref:DUF647-domain-containing protein n=1 Tax=Xylona heveae (strain CBS 132557 / TC161) TaxID=1328760 RepID=A0A165J5P8_XYLHT|nr:DUF647-domain-containing protein [Xylona heveae TC161]KZF25765.1 DUF647-domain-containing protein [Xylona heveae TC161]
MSLATGAPLEYVEKDQAGKPTKTYVESPVKFGQEHLSRFDVIPHSSSSKGYRTLSSVINAFLPAGYPQSVTEDYLEYQIYDSLQAFSSSIAGLLASRAVLQGVGVGDASASPTAALLLNVLQESMGRVATILFAHKLGSSLEPECKMYRLLADIFNDCAMVLDCLSPAFPRFSRVLIFSTASVLRALCGVAAGSAKASLSAHFARNGNLAELNAKDASQETIISLFGMLVGSIVISHVSTPFSTWLCLFLLLSIHLGTNYAAVRAVTMRTLNRQRANIVVSTLIEHDRILTPEVVSRRERIFERDGVVRWNQSQALAYCQIGCPLEKLLQSLCRDDARQSRVKYATANFGRLLNIFQGQDYILWYDCKASQVFIVLKEGSSVKSQLKAWMHSLLVVHGETSGLPDGTEISFDSMTSKQLEQIRNSLEFLSNRFDRFMETLADAGWDLATAALEVRPGYRLAVGSRSY